MDNPSSSLILPLYTLISICEKALFFGQKLLDKMRRKFPGGLVFDIPGTDNEADCEVIKDALEEKGFRFRIGVHRNGSDMLISNFLEKGTEEDLREFFRKTARDENEKKRIRALLEKLSTSVDEKMD